MHHTGKDSHDMLKRECDTASRCISEEKEYNKQGYDKTNSKPDLREGDKVVVYTFNSKNLKGPKKLRDSYLGPFNIIRLIGKNVAEVRLTEEFSRKHPVFPLSLVKPYHQKGKDKFPSRNTSNTPQEILEVEDSPYPVKKIIKGRKMRVNGKDRRKYLFIFKNQTAEKDKWLGEDAIPDTDLHLRKFRASRRADQSNQL
ncbi:hypothetical protein O181_012031 [Austropuccinia psidii MF-1]|uniref:Tf2-1-like SH3-like domain-containing protein n=1 Tax=Austropuccinia psidii MF-1 TaxID=1389203 RepID=A0A9Q3GLX0_9BASI|nr:hypothetical protein [Austropuccinia psidii MF-1]